jgi:hypothetical protein
MPDQQYGRQIQIGQQGGDPARGDRMDDISALREGGQTDYPATYQDDKAPWDDGARVGAESAAGYAPQRQRYPVNQSYGTRIITGRWDVPFTPDVRCEVLTPLMPDPLTGYGRKSISLYNNSSVIVYLGMDMSVTSTRDWPIPPGGIFVLDRDASSAIWMISTPSVVADIRFVMEMGFIGGIEGRTS